MKLIQSDCLKEMVNIPNDSVDIVFTSPPYADRRKNCYGGVPASEYVEWFLPITTEIKRVLKPTGSFFLNIKAHTQKGERGLYVMKLVIALREEVLFKFVDEFCWTKNAFPGAYRGRLKNGFEPVFHFTKINPSKITFNPTACGTPVKPESTARAYRKQGGSPANGSGMPGVNATNMQRMKTARPSNVVCVNNVSNQFTAKQKHPATFPVGLVDFFVKTFSNEGGVILDPFMGSGTVGVSCRNLGRDFIGIELNEDYFEIAKQRISEGKL